MTTTSQSITLTMNIAEVPGVGGKIAPEFRKLGIRCVADLLLHMPMRYEHEHEEQTIAKAGETVSPHHGADANIAVRGEIATCRPGFTKRQPYQATLQDSTGTMQLLWFNAPWMRGKLHPGDTIRVWGQAKRHGDYLQMINPKFAPYEPEEAVEQRSERFTPIYPASEAVSSTMIDKALDAVLEPAIALIDDHLSETYRKELALPGLADAYRMVHRPTGPDDQLSGRRRLAFDELLLLQLGVMMKRHHRREDLKAVPLKLNDAIDKHICARFSFDLTDSQREVIDEIAADLESERPMNRLLQGDVGSGKTVVALYAMLMAAASKHQAALMAPTELLAEQHFSSITTMLEGSTVAIELLTGSLKKSERDTILARLESGEIDILIGTHALLTESVSFNSLAVTVTDEQHRFGVHQRATLRGKTSEPNSSPHMLVMTATPIPRTLSLTVFGDLDISTIRTMPPGRQPIITKYVARSQSDDVYGYVRSRLDAGEQAYIVVPVIDESESGLKDVRSHFTWLENGHFQGKRIAAVHGRLNRNEREAIMYRFRRGEIHALIATTVIEVGVDVPNASIMVIENADRFGLAQLHQLRGRVGRGERKSLCVLIADPATDDGRARIEAIVAIGDGFEIAEKDLELRGPGELFGTRQSGIAPFRVASLPADIQLLRLARREAKKWINANPTLSGEADALLRKRLFKAHGKSLGLGDVA